MRPLSPDEEALWARVTATIAPLSRETRPHHPGPVAQAGSKAPIAVHPIARSEVKRPHVAPTRPGTTLDGSWDKRLRSGDVEPDRILDLHGMSLDQAWDAIDYALERAISRGDRLLLLITGHHRHGEPPIERGKIRAAVHDWLAVSRHARQIAAVRGAHRKHGGGGSLYLVLRRNSRPAR